MLAPHGYHLHSAKRCRRVYAPHSAGRVIPRYPSAMRHTHPQESPERARPLRETELRCLGFRLRADEERIAKSNRAALFFHTLSLAKRYSNAGSKQKRRRREYAHTTRRGHQTPQGVTR